MSKGDRANWKADPDDGTTPVANLLLEAMAAAPLNGTEKGALCYLMRKTYGWTNGGGQRKKEAEIPLAEWSAAMATHIKYAQRVLSGLVEKKVLLRVDKGKGKGYIYSVNTRIDQWLEGQLISLLPTKQGGGNRLVDGVKGGGSTKKGSLPPTNRLGVPPTNQLGGTDTAPAMPKESIKEILKKDNDNHDDIGVVGEEEGGTIFELYEKNFGEVTPLVEEELKAAQEQYSDDWIADAMREAARGGKDKCNLKYVAGILKRWKQRGKDAPKPKPGQEPKDYTSGKYGHVVRRA